MYYIRVELLSLLLSITLYIPMLRIHRIENY